MDSFRDKFFSLLEEFGKGKKMVLSTSLNDKVTSRMMSIIQKEGVFYFQTDQTFRKYHQLINNKNVALCMDNLQIEGICRELGHPLDYPAFTALYQECFPGSFERYSSLSHERLFSVTPFYMERWIYKGGVPFIETMDMGKQEYHLYEYKGI